MAKQPPRSNAHDNPAPEPAKPKRARSTRSRAAGAPAAPTEAAVARGTTADPLKEAIQPQTISSRSEHQPRAEAWQPTEEDIRVRAYHRFLERGGGHGMDFEDWLEAERELKAERG
jgi:hypothetical protein